jgi:hypothetical protein
VKPINLELIKAALTELDPTLEDSDEDDSYRTALILVSALVHGPDTRVLAEFTDLPREFVEAIRQRMIQAELWTEIEVFCDHWFGEGNAVCLTSFWPDVLIAQGLVVRQWIEEEGEYRYFGTAYTPSSDPSTKARRMRT